MQGLKTAAIVTAVVMQALPAMADHCNPAQLTIDAIDAIQADVINTFSPTTKPLTVPIPAGPSDPPIRLAPLRRTPPSDLPIQFRARSSRMSDPLIQFNRTR